MNNLKTIQIIKNNDEWLEWNNFTTACKLLKSSSLKIYIWLCSFQNWEEIIYSPKKIFEEINISISSAHRAFLDLEEKKFLIKNPKKDNYFFFYSMPK